MIEVLCLRVSYSVSVPFSWCLCVPRVSSSSCQPMSPGACNVSDEGPVGTGG